MFFIDNIIVNTLGIPLFPVVRMPRRAGRHFAIQWDVTRAHILGSQCSLRVAYRLIGARIMSLEHIRNITGSVEALVVCTPNCHHMDALRRTIPTRNDMLCEWPFCTMGGQWSIGRSLYLSILEHRSRFLVKE